MDDAEVGEVLKDRWAELGPGVRAAVDELVTATHLEATDATVPVARRRRRVGWASASAGAVLLTAAFGWLSSAQLSVPPYSTIPVGVQRITPAIPVDYTTTAGEQVACQAYLEFQHLSPGQIQDVETGVEARDWTGFGQTVYDRAVARLPETSRSAQEIAGEFGEVLDPAFTQLVTENAPSVRIRDFSSGVPTYNGYAMSCR